MSLDQFALMILLTLSGVFGVPSSPKDTQGWQVVQDWQGDLAGQQFVAESRSIASQCGQKQGHTIRFPSIVHAAHVIQVNGKVARTFGDPEHRRSGPFYGSPSLSCRDIVHGDIITWTVYSYSQYFGRFSRYPEVMAGTDFRNVFNQGINAVAGGALWLMAFFSLMLFLGKVPLSWAGSVASANFCFGTYLVASTAEWFGIGASTLFLHKVADCAIWLGSIALINGFRLQGLIGSRVFFL